MFRVIIADDESVIRQGLQILIDWESLGCEVVYSAKNGREVVDNIAATKPDIIVTDIRMPEVDGLELARYVSENGLPIKLILLTAYADFEYAKTAIKFGVVDYVTKTSSFDGLEKAVGHAMEQMLKERRQDKLGAVKSALENLFISIIHGSLTDETEIFEHAALIGLELRDYLVCLFRFRDQDEAPQNKRFKPLTNFLSTAFHEYQPHIVPVRRNLFCVVLDGVPTGYVDFAAKTCGEIISAVQNFMNLDVFVGVSERAESLSGFKAAYKQAEKAISGCSFLHMNERLFFFDDSKTAPPDDSFDRQISDLCGYIQKGRWAGVQGMFAKLLRRQVEARLTLEEIKNSGVVIESFCRRCLSQYNTRIEQVTEGSPPTPVIDVLSVDEYARTIREYIKAVMDYIDHAADNKTQLVAECDRLIAASDGMGINATSISRRLGVSSSYLSRVYKGKTGRTIIHAINMRKLERSKEYLDDPGVLIYEIAGHLGFENTTYFSHFFKKYTGMSPLAYRKRSPVIQKEPEG